MAAEIIIGNNTTSMLSFGDSDVLLVDANGFGYCLEFMRQDGEITSGDIQPGSTVQSWVSFTIPKDAQLESLKYTLDTTLEPLYSGL